MTTAIAITRMIARLLGSHTAELNAVNERLAEMQLPPFYLGLTNGLNNEYRLYDVDKRPPRFVVTWKGWRPGLALSELYLFYMPHVGDREPIGEDMITVKI